MINLMSEFNTSDKREYDERESIVLDISDKVHALLSTDERAITIDNDHVAVPLDDEIKSPHYESALRRAKRKVNHIQTLAGLKLVREEIKCTGIVPAGFQPPNVVSFSHSTLTSGSVLDDVDRFQLEAASAEMEGFGTITVVDIIIQDDILSRAYAFAMHPDGEIKTRMNITPPNDELLGALLRHDDSVVSQTIPLLAGMHTPDEIDVAIDTLARTTTLSVDTGTLDALRTRAVAAYEARKMSALFKNGSSVTFEELLTLNSTLDTLID